MMNSFRLSELKGALNAEVVGHDVEFERVNTDTRLIEVGDLFVALKGDRFDAHDFAKKAVELGAVAVVVERPLDLDVSQLVVKDTRAALGLIAEYNRTYFNGVLFAVTGSSGKTTVKEMLAEIMRGSGRVLATKGNLNNDIGVPLTLLNISPEHDFAVIEMGASGPGEICYSVNLAHPDIALVNNAMDAHLEGFGSLQGVVKAKGEIYDGLSAIGTAVVNCDDPNSPQWIKRAEGKRIVTFGVENPSVDVSATNLHQQESGCYGFTLTYQGNQADVKLNVLGRHNVSNALAASALAISAGVELPQIQEKLESCLAVKGRMYVIDGPKAVKIIDDSYNANPGSVKAAIQLLGELQAEKVFVLGDMGELGPNEEEIHYEIGRFAAKTGIERFLGVGRLSEFAVKGFREEGGESAQHYHSQGELIAELRSYMQSGMAVLVKGSRSAGMEKVVSGLIEEESK